MITETINNLNIILIRLRAEKASITGYSLKDTQERLEYEMKIEAIENCIRVLKQEK